MSGRYRLDTSIIIALFASDASVKENLAKAEETFVPVIAIGELCYGAHKSARSEENLRRIDEFAANSVVVGCDTSTAHHYGQVKNALRIKGRPIPENDIWIAAMALQHNLALVTRDEHFKEIEGLKVIVW